jgi:hypothetical protein
MADNLRAAPYMAPAERLDIAPAAAARSGPALSATSDAPQIERPAPTSSVAPPDDALGKGLARIDQALARGDQPGLAAAVRDVGAEWTSQIDRADKAAPGVAKIIHNPLLQISPQMAEAMLRSGAGVEVARHLGENPKVASQIARLGASAQAVEIGKLAAAVRSAPASRGEDDSESTEDYVRRRSVVLAEQRRLHGTVKTTDAPRQAAPARPRREESMESYLVRRQAELATRRIW